MRLLFLGSCANQTANQETVSFVVYADASTDAPFLLVDTGPGVVGVMQRLGVTCSSISRLFLTHVHADHISGYAYFVWNRFFESLGTSVAPPDLHVFGSQSVVEAAETLLSLSYDASVFPFKIFYHAVSGSERREFEGGIEVTFIDADHTVPTLGCAVRSSTRSFAYSCDTLATRNFTQSAKSVDLLVHEGMWDAARFSTMSERTKHATSLDAGQVAADSGVPTLALVHIFPSLVGSEGPLLAEAQSVYDGLVIIPSTGTSLQV